MNHFTKTGQRLGLALAYPLITLWLYWRGLDEYSAEEMLLASVLAVLVAVGIFLYIPVGQKSQTWLPCVDSRNRLNCWSHRCGCYAGCSYLGLAASVFCHLDAGIHICCQHIDAGSRWRFHNALQR